MSKHAGPSVRRIVRGRSLPGLLLFNPQGKLLSLNPIAGQLLGQGRVAPLLQAIRSFLRNLSKKRIKPKFLLRSPAAVPLPPVTFPSGRRTYGLRAFFLDGLSRRRSPVTAVLVERINPRRFDLQKTQRLFGLSRRESEVVRALQSGRTDKEIASALGISSETVRGYLKNIRSKLGVSTRIAIISKLQTILGILLLIYREIFASCPDPLI